MPLFGRGESRVPAHHYVEAAMVQDMTRQRDFRQHNYRDADAPWGKRLQALQETGNTARLYREVERCKIALSSDEQHDSALGFIERDLGVRIDSPRLQTAAGSYLAELSTLLAQVREDIGHDPAAIFLTGRHVARGLSAGGRGRRLPRLDAGARQPLVRRGARPGVGGGRLSPCATRVSSRGTLPLTKRYAESAIIFRLRCAMRKSLRASYRPPSSSMLPPAGSVRGAGIVYRCQERFDWANVWLHQPLPHLPSRTPSTAAAATRCAVGFRSRSCPMTRYPAICWIPTNWDGPSWPAMRKAGAPRSTRTICAARSTRSVPRSAANLRWAAMTAARCGRTTVDNNTMRRRSFPRYTHDRSIHGPYAKDLPQGSQHRSR
jgi:hypothetical protein